MKKALHRIAAAGMLLCFLYVQIPFALFHHHEHQPVCELNDHSVSHKGPDSKAHLHEKNDKPCFLCSAELIKEYSVKDFNFSFSVLPVSIFYLSSSLADGSSWPRLFSSRAPPVTA